MERQQITAGTPRSPAWFGARGALLALIATALAFWAPTAASAAVAQFDVGAGGGLAPKPVSNVAAGAGSFGVAVSPDGTSVYVTNAGSNEVSQFDVGAGGALSPKSPASVATGRYPLDVAVSPDGMSVYATSYNDGTVSQYDVGAGGVLSPKSPATVMTGNHGVVVSPDGTSVYVANYGSADVSQFDVGAGGRLTPKTPATVAAGSNPQSVAITPDGKNVYVTDNGSVTVSQFTVGAGGTLSPKSPATVDAGNSGSGAAEVAVSPDGASVYVTSVCGAGCDGTVSQFTVGASGALSPKSPATVTLGGGPSGIAVSPDGTHVYVTLEGDGGQNGSVAQFDAAGDGTLSPQSPATVGAFIYPDGIAISPDGKSVYVTNQNTPAPPSAPPSVTIAVPEQDATYSQGQVVDASYACSPGANGGTLKPGTAGCSGPVATGSPIDTSTPGAHSFTVTATDTDGQTATATSNYTVSAAVAAGPPSAGIVVPGQSASYSQGQVVDASYACSPGANGGTLKPGTAGCSGPVATGSPIDTSTPGAHSFTVTATDTDGQTATATSNYTVSAAVAAGPPSAGIVVPGQSASYSQGQVVDASYACSPGANGGTLKPGTAGCSGPVATGSPIDTSTPGAHSFTVTATDTDGQTATATSNYTVTAPPPPSAPPTNTGLPTIVGTALPGDTLTCRPGTWTGDPTSYSYLWSRGGTALPGATGPTYTVLIGDEAGMLSCGVVAGNPTGSSPVVSSAGVLVGYQNALSCQRPSGKLGGDKVGVFGLGMSRQGARKLNHRFNVTRNGFDNFCLYAGWGIRVGYPSKHLLGTLAASARPRFEDRAVLALTANPFYALSGVPPGTALSTVAKRLHLRKPFHVGVNFWYLLAGKTATGVLKVRDGVVQEVGLASPQLTATRKQQHTFIRSFS